MALINWLECEKEVSDKTVCCPNCGCPIGEKEQEVYLVQSAGKSRPVNCIGNFEGCVDTFSYDFTYDGDYRFIRWFGSW